MKTIFKNGTYERVSDEVAEQQVKFGRAKYVPKLEWKASARAIKSEKQADDQTKGEQTKSKKAEKAAKLKSKQRA
jgi:hypothetical protein